MKLLALLVSAAFASHVVAPRPIVPTAAGPLGVMAQPMTGFLEGLRAPGGPAGLEGVASLDLARPEHQAWLVPAAERLPEDFAARGLPAQAEAFRQAAAEVSRVTREEVQAAVRALAGQEGEAAYQGAVALMRVRAERSLYLDEPAREALDRAVFAATEAAGAGRRERLQGLWALALRGLGARLREAAAEEGPLVPAAPRAGTTPAQLGLRPAPPRARRVSAAREAQGPALAREALSALVAADRGSLRPFEEDGILHLFPGIAAHLLRTRTRRTSDEAAAREVAGELGVSELVTARYYDAFRRILAFAGRAPGHAGALGFATALARLDARRQYLEPAEWTPYGPLAALVPGDVWDLGSVVQPETSLPRLDPARRHVFFDLDPFIAARLAELVELMREDGFPADHIEVARRDVRALERPARPLALIHMKNMLHYAPGLEARLEEMLGWLADGGRLVVRGETAPDQRRGLAQDLGPIARRLLARGWTFAYRLGRDDTGRWEWDELVFTKPLPGPPQPTVPWDQFEKEIGAAH